MTHFSTGGLAVDYPSDWKRDRSQEGSGGLVLFVVGDSGTSGVPFRMGLYDQDREYASAAQYGKDTADTRPADLHGDLVSEGRTDVAGADGAWRVVTDYRVHPDGGGGPVPARGLDILPIAGDRQYRLTISGPRDAMQGDQIEAIADSLRVGAGT